MTGYGRNHDISKVVFLQKVFCNAVPKLTQTRVCMLSFHFKQEMFVLGETLA